MKKIILSLNLCLLIMLSASAQNKTEASKSNIYPPAKPVIKKLYFSVGADEGFTVGQVADHSSVAIGLSAQGEYLILKELGVTLNAGYLYFIAKGGGHGLPLVPVMAGLNYHITPKIFLSGQLGTSFFTGDKADKDKEVKRGYFSYAQGVGYQVSNRISLLAKYQGINVGGEKNYSFIGLRVAYTLP